MTAEARLGALFTEPREEAFAPDFLRQVPFEKVQRVLRQAKKWGTVRGVRSQGEEGLWELETERGVFPFLATFDAEGRVVRLLTPSAPLDPRSARLGAWSPWALLLIVPADLLGVWGARTRWDWLLNAPSDAAFAAFLLTLYVWPQTSIRLQKPMAVALALLVASAVRVPGLPPGSFPGAWTLVGSAVLLAMFGGLAVFALLGRRMPAGTVALGPVLRGGTFVAAQAGSTRIVNYHMAYPPMRYAADYLGVGANGRHAKGIMPADPARYAIFGATVLAPLDGVVEHAKDGLPDLPPPRRDPLRPAGNSIVLRATAPDGREVRIVFAHLREGSVRVGVGDAIRAGDALGEVGNSGNTTEPHLHLGVTVGGVPGDPLSGEGVPFTVAGRFPVRGMTSQTG